MDLESISVRVRDYLVTYTLMFFMLVACLAGASGVGFVLLVLSLLTNLAESALVEWRIARDEDRLERQRQAKLYEEHNPIVGYLRVAYCLKQGTGEDSEPAEPEPPYTNFESALLAKVDECRDLLSSIDSNTY